MESFSVPDTGEGLQPFIDYMNYDVLRGASEAWWLAVSGPEDFSVA